MLAERLPGLLPDLDAEAALEVTQIYSAAGLGESGGALITRPPFRAPHHSSSLATLIGGGGRDAFRPGAASLAHRGVLLLDDAPEFSRAALATLAQPLATGEVHITRAGATARFPARFQLVLTAAPCPCVEAVSDGSCCARTPAVERRYLARIPAPLLDRIDVRVEVPPAGREEPTAEAAPAEPTAAVADRVREARARAAARLAGTPWRTNAEVPGREIRSRWRPDPAGLRVTSAAMEQGRLTRRGLERVLRVAWTIADLAGHGRPTSDDISTALRYRDRQPGTQ
jgi:magnesium chelatase family protein